jgi:glyoxylase-like metal-dependent hydrolase (beta-lactamase superfamily II)
MSTPSRKAEDGFVPGKMDDGIKMNLNITLLQTPGHTPDSMAWYDERERHLYVGDTFYEGEIIFPPDGNWIHYMASLHKLLEFVRQENAATSPLDADEEWVQVLPRVKVGCAHSTSDVNGVEIIEEVITLFERIIAGKVPVMKSQEIRGELYKTWKEDYAKLDPPAKYKFSVRGPVRLCEEVRRNVKQVEKSFYFF